MGCGVAGEGNPSTDDGRLHPDHRPNVAKCLWLGIALEPPSSSLLKKVFEVSLWATLIQDPSARRTKDSQPSGFGFEYCASHVRFRVFQQTAKLRFRIRRQCVVDGNQIQSMDLKDRARAT